MPDQSEWRFCHKCNAMFFNGFPTKGHCSAGGVHDAAGFTFVLPHDIPETPKAQSSWRFCQKCFAMYFDGFPTKGHCASGGAHSAAGFTFVLPHDVPDSTVAQGAWRFCQKCNAMYFDGFPTKGVCPAGGPHSAAGFNFVLPHIDDDLRVFDSGPLTSSLPLGGSAHLELRRNGTFNFSGHAHDSGFDNIDYGMAAVFFTASGVAFTFQHEGHVEGTSAGLPFGTPDRNDDFLMPGSNPIITSEWQNIAAGKFVAKLTGKDTLLAGISGIFGDLIKSAAQQAGKAAATAVIALL